MPRQRYRGGRGSKFARHGERQGPIPMNSNNNQQSTSGNPRFGRGNGFQQKSWKQSWSNRSNKKQNQESKTSTTDNGKETNEAEFLKHLRENVNAVYMARLKTLRSIAEVMQEKVNEVSNILDDIHPDHNVVMDWQLSPGTVVYVPVPHPPADGEGDGESLHPEICGSGPEFYPCRPSSFPDRPYDQFFPTPSQQHAEQQEQNQPEPPRPPMPSAVPCFEVPKASCEENRKTRWVIYNYQM